MTVDGPTGYGVGGQAVGCKPFWDRLKKNARFDPDRLLQCGGEIDTFLKENKTERLRFANTADKMNEMLTVVSFAHKFSQ